MKNGVFINVGVKKNGCIIKNKQYTLEQFVNLVRPTSVSVYRPTFKEKITQKWKEVIKRTAVQAHNITIKDVMIRIRFLANRNNFRKKKKVKV